MATERLGYVEEAAQDSGAAADLSRHLQRGSTGRLSARTRNVEVDVYVMNGQVVAAESTDDIKLLLRRLYAAKAVTRARATELGGMADLGEGVFGILLEEVDPPLMDAALFERFRDNVTRFLGVRAAAAFHPMGAVFVENFQMGHKTDELLLECAKLWRQSQHVPLSMVLSPGYIEDATTDQLAILQNLDGRLTVRQVLHEVPIEPVFGRAVIAQMLANGIARKVRDDEDSSIINSADVYEEANTNTDIAATRTAVAEAPAALHEPEELDEEDDDYGEQTVLVDTSIYSREYLPDDIDLMETEVMDNHVPSVQTTAPSDDVWDDYLGAGLEILDDPSDYRRGLPAGTADDMLDEDSPTVMADWDYTAGRRQRQESPATSAAVTIEQGNDPQAWLSHDVDIDDDLMEAFADHDQVRGGDSDGSFSQEQLERIEVNPVDSLILDDSASSDNGPIEIGEAPSSKFAARTLSDEEARNKIDVANDNLLEIVRCFDAASGSGRGRAAVQLLIEGCPTKFAPLFHDANVRVDGSLPIDRLLRNIQVRPATEHRQLLNQGLVDLIERALSLVMDEIEEDDAIDEILESTAGYRQRIGL